MEDKEKYRESSIRWAQIAIAQMGYAINLFIVLSTASIAYLFSLMEKTGFHSTSSFIFAIVFLGLSALSGIVATITRLWDFRYTRKKWNKRLSDHYDDAKHYMHIATTLGKATWIFLIIQVCGFLFGVIFIAVHVLGHSGNFTFGWFTSSTIEVKDLFYILGILATFFTALLSLREAKKNSKKITFINSITSSRIKWIDVVRVNISQFCGSAFNAIGNEQEQSKIAHLKYLIKLQLNRGDEFDKKIMAKLDVIVKHVTEKNRIELENEINQLIELTQDLLKLEWEGAKQESMHGILSEDEKGELYEKYLRTKKNKHT